MKNRRDSMTSQTVLGRFGTESVCKTCKHLDKLEGRFYCKFLCAFLAEETLYLPCDMRESDNEEKLK